MSIDPKVICERFIHADCEADVIEILKEYEYWDNPNYWRDFGDMENNFSTAGAQQSDPIAALVEKLVNSADALLMNECQLAGLDPDEQDNPELPTSVREAVAKFIQKLDPKKEANGLIENMDRSERRKYAKKITLATTGSNSKPCITIVDQGEGQTPDMIPKTLMSLNKNNKLRVPFVHGRYNMGVLGLLGFVVVIECNLLCPEGTLHLLMAVMILCGVLL